MIALSFWVAVVWPDSEGAVLSSIAAVIFTGLVANLIVVQFVESGPLWLSTLLELIPSFALFRGLYEMSQYAFLADANGGPGRGSQKNDHLFRFLSEKIKLLRRLSH